MARSDQVHGGKDWREKAWGPQDAELGFEKQQEGWRGREVAAV